MAKQKTISPRLDDKDADFYATLFGNKNAGAEYMLAAFPALYRSAQKIFKAVLTSDEQKLIIDSYNSTMITPDWAGRFVSTHITDAIELEKLDEKWDVKKKDFIAKLETLDTFTLACIEIFAKAFWEQETITLEDYCI